MKRTQAISFDLWDTVFLDDSDEAARASRKMPTKREERRLLVYDVLSRRQPMSRALVDCAYDITDAAFNKVWLEQAVTWTVAERLEVLLTGLHRKLPGEMFRELVKKHEEMELAIMPELVPGIEDALRTLSERAPLIVVSDTVFSPGWALRKILDAYGILGYFQEFVFSDELGCSKPNPRLFERAAELAGCPVESLIHIGDRESNDVDGPHAVGARAILTTVAVDRGSHNTQADAVCRRYIELAEIIEKLDAEGDASDERREHE